MKRKFIKSFAKYLFFFLLSPYLILGGIYIVAKNIEQYGILILLLLAVFTIWLSYKLAKDDY